MTLEQTVYDFNEIVPTPKSKTWAERNIPTFLGLVQKIRYNSKENMPEEKREYPLNLTIKMPEIKWNAGKTHALLRFYDKANEVIEKIKMNHGERRCLRFLLDEISLGDIINVNFHSDGTFFGEIRYHTMAIDQYTQQWFAERGYNANGKVDMHEHAFIIKIAKK